MNTVLILRILFVFELTALQVYIGRKYKVVKVYIQYPKDSIDPISPSYHSYLTIVPKYPTSRSYKSILPIDPTRRNMGSPEKNLANPEKFWQTQK